MDFSSPSGNRYGGAGGFHPLSQGMNDSPSSSSGSMDARSKKRDLQSVSPVTVRQILSGDLSDKLIIDGKEIGQIELVGNWSNLEIKSSMIEYHFHDLTGVILVRMFQTNEGDELNELKRKELVEEFAQYKYVRVYGSVRAMNEERVFWAQAIRPVLDMNAVTYHSLNVLHNHLRNTKSPLPSTNSSTQRQNTSSNFHSSSSSSSAHSSHLDHSIAYSHGNNINGESFTPLQQDVLSAVSVGTHDDTGCNVNEVIHRLQSKFSITDIQAQIAFLTEEGHLFTTIDEQHIKLTSNA